MQLTHCNCNDCSCNYNKHKECTWKRSFKPARPIATSPKARSATAEREHRNGTGRERERKTAHLRLQTAATNRIQLPSTLVTCSGCSLSAITSCTSCAAVAQQQAATRRTRSVRWRMQRWLQLTLPRILRQKVKQRKRARASATAEERRCVRVCIDHRHHSVYCTPRADSRITAAATVRAPYLHDKPLARRRRTVSCCGWLRFSKCSCKKSLNVLIVEKTTCNNVETSETFNIPCLSPGILVISCVNVSEWSFVIK